MKRLLKRDLLGESWFDDDEGVIVDTLYDVEPVLERNKLIAETQKDQKMGRHVGSIDLRTRDKWFREWRDNYSDAIEWMPFLVSKLNNGDHKKFRSWRGNL